MRGTSALARTLNLVQVEIERQAAIPEFVTIRGIEDRLERAMFAEWSEKARDAIARAFRSVPETLTEDYLRDVPAALIEGFRGWPSRDLQAMARESVETIYQLSARVIARKAAGVAGYKDRELRLKAAPEVEATFNTADRDAMAWLVQSQVFWMGQHFDADVVEDIRRVGWVELAGRSGASAGKELKALAEDRFGVGAFSSKGKAYFEGVAINASTTARVSGSMLQMQEIGITHYVFMAVMDERTTAICQHMDGQQFSVREATDRIDQMVKSGNPAAVRSLHGWNPGGFLDALSGAGVTLTPGTPLSAEHSSIVMAHGFAFPPLHFRCRSTVDIGYASEAAPADRDPNAFPWEPHELKIVGDSGQGLGGVNAKVVLEAPDGSRWLFKPYTHRGEQDEYRAYADKLAADVAKALDHPTAEVYTLTLPKGHEGLRAMTRVGDHKPATGSVQKWTDGVKGTIGTTSWKDLTKDQLLHVQKEHALDWLISNHDDHLENLLLLEGDKVLGIDKGQAFKFFGRDRLHWTYSPNAGGGFHAPYFNEQAEKYAAGAMGRRFVVKGPDDNPELLAFLEKIRDLGDDEFLAMIRPYSSRAASAGIRWAGMSEDQFLQALLERKRSIVEDYRKFYKDLNAARKTSLPPIPRKPKAPPVVTPITDEFVKDIDAAGWEGKNLLLADHDKIEGGQVLLYGMDGDGTVLEMYLTKDGDSALASALGDAIPQKTGRAIVSDPADSFFDPTLKTVKSLVAHLGDPAHSVYDGQITDQTWSSLKSMKAMKALPSSMTPHEQAAFDYYYNQVSDLIGGFHHITVADAKPSATTLESIKNAVQSAKGKGFAFGRYAAPVPAPKAAPSSLFKVEEMATHEWNARLGPGGRIQFTSVEGRTFSGGGSWSIRMQGSKPPIRVLYTPHNGNSRSKTGRLRIMIEGEPAKTVTRAQIEDALGVLQGLGARSDLAQPIDVEAEYLRKVTRAAKLHLEPGFNLPRGLPSSEVVDRLSSAWSARLGVKDARKLKDYDPAPQNANGRGWARWFRFDVTDKMLEGFQLDHQLYSGTESFFNITATGARGLVSTETKLRIGVPPGGMSPEEDMETGGAVGVFTRIFREDRSLSSSHIRLDPKLIRDVDNLIYRSDLYGRNDDATFMASHQTDFGKRNLRDIADSSSNETVIRWTVPYDYIRQVGVGSSDERDRVLQTLRAAGVDNFGGVPIEDVIKVVR